MTVSELLPTLSNLGRADKLRVMQFLLSELAKEEETVLQPGESYPVWSPYEAREAGDALLAALAADDQSRRSSGA